MTTDADCAKLCTSIYGTGIKWDKLWQGGIYVGMLGNILCFRGSETVEDWMIDMDAIPVNDVLLGCIHEGFAAGMYSFFASIEKLVSEKTILCGHSLGAARAMIFGGYMKQVGVCPKAIITFGCPQPGFAQLKAILAPVIIRSYRNGLDPVPELPREIEPYFGYEQPRDLISVGVIKEGVDVAAYHFSANYVPFIPETIIV